MKNKLKLLSLIAPVMFLLSSCGDLDEHNNACKDDYHHVNLVFEREIQPTCTENLKKVYKCSKCGKEVITDDPNTSALGHVYSSAIDVNCPRCGETYVDNNLMFKLNDTNDGYIVAWKDNKDKENDGFNHETQYVINIPEEYKGLPVVEVADEGFYYVLNEQTFEPTSEKCAIYDVRVINIPASVKKIGRYAFNGIYAKRVFLHDGLEMIDDGAFCDADIAELSLPSSVAYIGESAFGSSCVTSLELPESIEYIGHYAFVGLKCITLNSDITGKEINLTDSINTVINKTNVIYDKDEFASTYCNDISSYHFEGEKLEFRETDCVNFKKTIYAKGVVKIRNSRGHSFTEEERDNIPLDIYYTNIEGKNYLTNVYSDDIIDTPYGNSGDVSYLTEYSIPEGITYIENAENLEWAQIVNLPDSLEYLDGHYDGVLNVNEYTVVDIYGYEGYDHFPLLKIREDTKRHVKLDTDKLLELFNSEDHTYTYGGIKFELNSESGITDIDESVVYSKRCMTANFDDLDIKISFVDENDDRVPTHINISGKDAMGLTNQRFRLKSYYYDQEEQKYKDYNESGYQYFSENALDVTAADVDKQSEYLLSLKSYGSAGLFFEYIEIEFDYNAPLYNGDLSIVNE